MEPEVLLQWSWESATGHILSQINPIHTNPVSLTLGAQFLDWFEHNLASIYSIILVVWHPSGQTVAGLSNILGYQTLRILAQVPISNFFVMAPIPALHS
jgi:hypothetical protein